MSISIEFVDILGFVSTIHSIWVKINDWRCLCGCSCNLKFLLDHLFSHHFMYYSNAHSWFSSSACLDSLILLSFSWNILKQGVKYELSKLKTNWFIVTNFWAYMIAMWNKALGLCLLSSLFIYVSCSFNLCCSRKFSLLYILILVHNDHVRGSGKLFNQNSWLTWQSCHEFTFSMECKLIVIHGLIHCMLALPKSC